MPDAAQHPAQPELPSPYQPGKRRGRARRSHTVAKVLLATLLTLGMVSGLSVAFLYRHLNGNLNVVDVSGQLTDRPEKIHITAPKQPINILVMGSDSRDCDGCGIDKEAGGGSDTTLLFHLSADRESAYGVSIPRDSLVDRPDCKSEDGDTIPGGSNVMWNAAYSYGGPACTIQQFEQTTGIQIDNYVVVDFGSFKGMVDAVDGVEVCVPEDIDSSEYGITIQAGTRTLRWQGGARLRPGPPRRRRRQRHRPDQAPAGVHRRTGRQGALQRHADALRPAGRASSTRPRRA